MLDSGKPIIEEYTKEIVSNYIGKRVRVTYFNKENIDIVTLNVTGVILDSLDNKTLLLLGRTEFKYRMVIPINNIKDIK